MGFYKMFGEIMWKNAHLPKISFLEQFGNEISAV